MTKFEAANNDQAPENSGYEPEPESAFELNKQTADAESEKLSEENGKLKDQLLRALADAENTRRRAALDVEDAGKYAIVSFARDLINVLENLNRAEQNAPADSGDGALKNYIEGVTMTRKELLGTFEKHGIKRIDPMGEKFDHNFHQAIAQVESEGKEPGTVVSVVQAGYVIRDRLLRPAMVAVAKAPEKKETPPSVDTEA